MPAARRQLVPALFATLCLGTTAPALADPVEAILERARADCAGFENGTFDAGDAVTRIDLTGDGQPDALVDLGKTACSSAASLYCGTGGCSLYGVVGEQVSEWQSLGWRTLEWGPDLILLIARDGGWCGGAGAERCYEALNWSNGRFLTVMPPPPKPAAD